MFLDISWLLYAAFILLALVAFLGSRLTARFIRNPAPPLSQLAVPLRPERRAWGMGQGLLGLPDIHIGPWEWTTEFLIINYSLTNYI